MRKPDKQSLRNARLTDESTKSVDTIEGKHMIDGGELLHRVHWRKGMTFTQIAEAYVSYIRNNYGQAHIVFDGYDDAMSTKSNEHSRRSRSKGSSQKVLVRQENEVPYSKERFLSNTHNKSQLISLLSDFLTRVLHICKGDADTKIVATAHGSNIAVSQLMIQMERPPRISISYKSRGKMLEH